MMVLVAVAIGAGWLYSVYVTLTGGGEVFYEAATVLAVFVLLGHWFEMRARSVFPTTKEQRCWWHKSGALAALPKSAQPAARAALAEIYNAEDKTHTRAAAKTFAAEFGVKWPKAAAKITDNLDVLLAFYDYPAEHWIHPRTTNPVESTFATVRAQNQGHQGSRLPRRRRGHGVQADRGTRPGGGWSTHPTWSHSSAPEPSSSTANSSSDTTTKINKEVVKRRETRQSRARMLQRVCDVELLRCSG
jgi:Transposase, Mutator family